ncbi:hypothetical protein BDK51DRAFT_12315, partial [Blyttiomyces helicus]
IIECGFAPLFTPENYTVDMLNASVWSWEPGQPQYETDLNCAAMNLASGKWFRKVPDFTTYIHHAQTINPAPSAFPQWTIATQISTFDQAASLCPASYDFAVPRTPQENVALAAVLRQQNFPALWVNLNQVEAECWVVGWLSPCPY